MVMDRREFTKIGLEALVLMSLGYSPQIALSQQKTIQEYVPQKQPLLPKEFRRKLTPSDYAIALKLQELCSDGLERGVIYIPSKKKFELITSNSTLGSADLDTNKVSDIIKKEKYIIEAHVHPFGFKRYMYSFPRSDNRRWMIEKLGPEVIRRRFLLEVPSAEYQEITEKGFDINTMIYIYEDECYKKHENGHVGHRIIVLEPGLPSRVISYGITDEQKKILREAIQNYWKAEGKVREIIKKRPKSSELIVYRARSGGAMDKLNQIRKDLITTYCDIYYDYLESHCEPWTIEECKEPSFTELATQINQSELIII